MAKKTAAAAEDAQRTMELPQGVRGGDVLNSDVPKPSQPGPLDNGKVPQAAPKDSVADNSRDSSE